MELGGTAVLWFTGRIGDLSWENPRTRKVPAGWDSDSVLGSCFSDDHMAYELRPVFGCVGDVLFDELCQVLGSGGILRSKGQLTEPLCLVEPRQNRCHFAP